MLIKKKAYKTLIKAKILILKKYSKLLLIIKSKKLELLNNFHQ